MSPRCAWRLLPAQPAQADALAARCGIHPLVAQLLLHRGITDPAEARRFFSPGLEALTDPLALPEMAAAAARIRRAIAARETILVFGDSDVDGITASAIVHEALTTLGANVLIRLSNRLDDGYGFPPSLAACVARSRITLVILLDCGTNQATEVDALAARGVDTIVLDHHVPTAQRARPLAMVNPRLCGDPAMTGYCSAGLAIKLIQALCPGDATALTRAIDLAALGTLADYAPLLGDNRILVASGVERILEARPGLAQVCRDVELTKALPEQILRRLVPRLNAPGRLGLPKPVWRLLVERSDEAAQQLAVLLGEHHTTTKTLHRQVVAEATEQASRMHFKDHSVMVIGRRGWHSGLMGPVAAQLVDRFNRPAIAVALDGQTGTGSGRSMDSFNLFEALKACEAMLLRYGGHPQACGLTISAMNLDAFRDRINEHARRAAQASRVTAQALEIEAETTLGELTDGVLAALESFAPFGKGNPRPLLLVRGVVFQTAADGTRWLEDGAVKLRVRERLPEVSSTQRYDAVVGATVTAAKPVLTVRDLCSSSAPTALW